MVASDGGIFAFGDAQFAGSAGSQALNKPIVAMAPTPSGLGYWMVASDGGIFAFGDAPFVGSAGGLTLNKPIVVDRRHPVGPGLLAGGRPTAASSPTATPRFCGSTSKLTLSKPIVTIVATPTGKGYWLVASDGGIFAFGDARSSAPPATSCSTSRSWPWPPPTPARATGWWRPTAASSPTATPPSTARPAHPLNKKIVGMTTTPLGKGYWMVATDGGDLRLRRRPVPRLRRRAPAQQADRRLRPPLGGRPLTVWP